MPVQPTPVVVSSTFCRIAVIGAMVAGFEVAGFAGVSGFGAAGVREAAGGGGDEDATVTRGHGSLGCCDFATSSAETTGSPPLTGCLHWMVSRSTSDGNGGVVQCPFSSVVVITSGYGGIPVSRRN